jgi:phosphinothricin acetyltransferase
VGSIALFEKAGFIKCAHFKNVAEKFNTVLDVVMFQKEI